MCQKGRNKTPAFLLYWNCAPPVKTDAGSPGCEGNSWKHPLRSLFAGFGVALVWLWCGFGVAAIGTQLKSESIIQKLENLPKNSYPDVVRIHIPRALRLVYDIRNKRDVAHLGDGIDPNLQDATMIASVLDWVLAEFIRLYHNVTANVAQQLVSEIVTRAVPVIQDFNGFPKVLKPNLAVSDDCLVLLYQRGDRGCTFQEIHAWVRPQMRANLGRTLNNLVEAKDFAHFDGNSYYVTRLGQQEVEIRHLVDSVV